MEQGGGDDTRSSYEKENKKTTASKKNLSASSSPAKPSAQATKKKGPAKSAKKSETKTKAGKNNNSSKLELSPSKLLTPNGEAQNTDAKLKTNAQVVLTHVIDGYVIKESAQPFPLKNQQPDKASNAKKQQKQEQEGAAADQQISSDDQVKCAQCSSATAKKEQIGFILSGDDGVVFCSNSCLKRHSKKSASKPVTPAAANKRFKHNNDESKTNGKTVATPTTVMPTSPAKDPSATLLMDTSNSTAASPSKKSSCHHHKHKHHKRTSSCSKQKCGHNHSRHEASMDSTFAAPHQISVAPPTSHSSPNSTINGGGPELQDMPRGDPAQWNCDEVVQFVNVVTGGNAQVAQVFRAEDIDGSALSLIRDDHLVSTMQIKLGPALKIMSKFNEMKSRFAAAGASANANVSQSMIQA
jgi:hypothetical protein